MTADGDNEEVGEDSTKALNLLMEEFWVKVLTLLMET